MAQSKQLKTIIIDRRAVKELNKCPLVVRLKFKAAFELLEEKGFLEAPLSKKLSNNKNLFEIRIKIQSQWRSIYAYATRERVIILSSFQKKNTKNTIKRIRKS